jgi:hypothetical protein
MKHTPEMPKGPTAEEGEDVDVSDFAQKPARQLRKDFGSGIKDFEPAELDKNFEAEGRKLAPEGEGLQKRLEDIVDKYFASSGLLKMRFGGDSAAKARFKGGLVELIRQKGTAYGYMDEHTRQVDIEGLSRDERFWNVDLYEYAEKFVREEAERRRRAA